MNNQVQIRFTAGSWIGLAVLSILTVGLFSGSMMAFHPVDRTQPSNILQPNGNYQPHGNYTGDSVGNFAGNVRPLTQPMEVSPPVNTSARDEIKQQCSTRQCPTIQYPQYPSVNYSTPTYIAPSAIPQANGNSEASAESRKNGATLSVVRGSDGSLTQCYAILKDGRVWNSTGQAKTTIYAGPNCFLALLQEMKQGVRDISLNPVSSPVSIDVQNPEPRYQLAIFVNNQEAAKSLQSWFKTHSGLATLKRACAFLVYTADNPLYVARYAGIVPASNFPAVLFLKPDGGHIYASGGPMLPRSADQLYSDMKEAYRLSASVESAPVTAVDSGAIKNTGYNWDQSISPEMQLIQYQGCPDGNCPDDNSQIWRPGQRVRDIFGPKDDGIFDLKNAILWTSSSEIVTLGLLILVGLLGFAIWRKLS
jgi:hypothetical protein